MNVNLDVGKITERENCLLVGREPLVVERRTGLGAHDSCYSVGRNVTVAANIDGCNDGLRRSGRSKTRDEGEQADNYRRKGESQKVRQRRIRSS
jgi:hypothetical protein